MKPTGGKWDKNERNIYFNAGSISMHNDIQHLSKHLLIAINEIGENETDIEEIEALCDSGHRVFIDSGVFWLTNEHARKNDVTMDVALSLAPEEIDDFDWLFEKYVKVITRLKDKVWGYIEIDQGGMANKKRTRARLEALGLNPIPVYHPINDGWDYFDELGENYDRICVGNVVQADTNTRKRIATTIYERKRKYPNLFYHLLGYTPNSLLNAFPCDSCDSTSWFIPCNYPPSFYNKAMLHPINGLDRRFWYDQKKTTEQTDGKNHRVITVQLGAYDSVMYARNWNHILKERKELCGESY